MKISPRLAWQTFMVKSMFFFYLTQDISLEHPFLFNGVRPLLIKIPKSRPRTFHSFIRRESALFSLSGKHFMLENDFSTKIVWWAKKRFSFPKVGRSRFYPAHARNCRFRMCVVPNSGTFQKHHFSSKYKTRFQIENFGSKRMILVLDLEQIVPIWKHWFNSQVALN